MKKETKQMMKVLGEGIRNMATNRALTASRYSVKEFMYKVSLTDGSFIFADWSEFWKKFNEERRGIIL